MLSVLSSLLGSACASEAAGPWLTTAQVARFPNKAAEAERLVAKLPGDTRKKVDAVLSAMAAEPATPAGIGAAAGRLREAIPTFVDPNSESSGLEPAIEALTLGGQAVLKGQLVAAGKAIAASPSPDAEAMELVRQARALADLDRWADASFLQEAEAGLGGDLYVRAARALDGKPPL